MSDGEEIDIDVESTDNLPQIKIERTEPPPQETTLPPQLLPHKLPELLAQAVPDLLPQIKVEIKEAAEFLAESLCSMVGLQVHGAGLGADRNSNVWFKPSFMCVDYRLFHRMVFGLTLKITYLR